MEAFEAPNPLFPPTVEIPASLSTVDVRVIDTNTRLYLKPGDFWEPILPGFEGTHSPVYCFLISHGNRHIVFDLGVRIDWEEALPPKTVQFVKATTTVEGCEKDVVSMLDEDTSGLNIRSSDIEAVIWSHNHFDHTGDPSRFPSHTELVVGPGVKGISWPGYPSIPDASILDSDAAGRSLREIDFEASDLKIGLFDSFDFFGDGSFYLLDAPGHAPGHMCGLARTTSDPPTFVFMGADSCHHAGVLRPSQYLHLPRPASMGQIRSYGGCRGDLLMQLASWKSADEPFFQVARGHLFSDHDAAMITVSKIQELDADVAGNIFVILTHDDSLGDHLPLFPRRINDWLAQNLREETRWIFCKSMKDVRPS
ncbi:Metallo-hydrolase/oxidoreductase [Penicillium herquei]|nr:Metallo-hydrolase/oxidoreductase [Penicillium herquei]